MDLLVIGCGSIGRRHIKNLLGLGHKVTATDVSADSRKAAGAALGVAVVETTEAGLALKPQAVLVCTPPSTHLELAAKAINAGAHVFIEKPVSDTPDGIGSLEKLAAGKGKMVQVGYNLRYIPALAKLKQVLGAGTYGKALSARVIFAQYLPYWRPGTDYRQGYTGKKKFGGGIILEASHELDYICWLLGKPVKLSCAARKVSSLDVDTEDTADVLVDFEGGALANVHLDFVRQEYERGCEIECEKATLVWKLGWRSGRSTLEARSFNPAHPEAIKSETLLDVPWDTNDMYVEEMKSFISAIGAGRKPSPGLQEGGLALRLALKALESSEKGKAVKV
ncbi:MAG: Gfo/Idh/MocA family oxidoreductase [Candidatus ainarchaeum sp.]|nr:Gfo/Idh/MocA family oxidoreductase [Candidatus ainarchaeum sp.]